MKDWEKILAERREAERTAQEARNERFRRESEERNQQRLAEEQREAEILARQIQERTDRETQIFEDLKVREILEDINETEWQGRGQVMHFTGREIFRQWYHTSSRGGMGWYNPGGEARVDHHHEISGLQLISDYTDLEGPKSTFIRVYLRYPRVYSESINGVETKAKFDYDLEKVDRVYVFSGEDQQKDDVNILDESPEETRRQISPRRDDSKLRGIPIFLEDGIVKNPETTIGELQFRLALDCERRRNEKRTLDLISDTSSERIRSERAKEKEYLAREYKEPWIP